MTRLFPTSLSVAVLGYLAMAVVPAAAATTIANRTITAEELASAVARDRVVTLQSVIVKGDLTLGRPTRGLPLPLPFDLITGSDITFTGAVTIDSSSEIASLRLTGATFQRLVVASGTFYEFHCISCTFLGDASFAYMTVRDFDLVGSSLNGYADFRGLTPATASRLQTSRFVTGRTFQGYRSPLSL